MRKKYLLTLLSASILFIGGCSKNAHDKSLYIDKPSETNLEFWITQRVTLEEMENKGCTFLPGWMGASEYLDSRYTAEVNGGMETAPEIHVTYLVTGYPDTLDDLAVTHIEITDPSIAVYGLTLNSTEVEIREKMDDIANSFVNEDECLIASVESCSFSFSSERIIIDAPVTNNSGVIY